MAELAPEWITPEEYLRRERLSPTKNEYWNGHIYPWGEPLPPPSGGARRRALLVTNVVGALRERLEGTALEIYASAIKLTKEFGFDVAVASEPVFEENTLV